MKNSNKQDECKGCRAYHPSTGEKCMIYCLKENNENCPCLLCLVKPICNKFCEAVSKFLEKKP